MLKVEGLEKRLGLGLARSRSRSRLVAKIRRLGLVSVSSRSRKLRFRLHPCQQVSPALPTSPDVFSASRTLQRWKWSTVIQWIITAHHLCSLLGMLSRYTVLEVWAVRRPMCVRDSRRWGRCVLFINILDSLTAPCLVYKRPYMQFTASVAGTVHTLAGAADAWFIQTPTNTRFVLYILLLPIRCRLVDRVISHRIGTTHSFV